MTVKDACAGALGALFLAVFVVLIAPTALTWPVAVAVSPDVGAALWNGRTYEALLQGMIVLAGVLSILLLLGLKQSGRMPP